jgi:hypothetical protein
MLRVFITVDTELWPFSPDWRETGLKREMARDIDGSTAKGEFGIRYQMAQLNEYGLKAVFFVESLFACVVGGKQLGRIVKMIKDMGHEVQLHIHTEWLARMEHPLFPGRSGRNMKDFSREEQVRIIEVGMKNLGDCGAGDISAFRAGNFGANFDTLEALCVNGIHYDTSYSISYLDSHCGLRLPDPLIYPKRIHGVHEFPVSFFRDYPGHFRHAQLGACTSRELESALLGAWERGWYSFVLVSHSFELIKRRGYGDNAASPDRIAIRRFDRLCRFLAGNQEKFKTTGFSDISAHEIPDTQTTRPLDSSWNLTVWRMLEQMARRAI